LNGPVPRYSIAIVPVEIGGMIGVIPLVRAEVARRDRAAMAAT
jgi:hypothetical protein